MRTFTADDFSPERVLGEGASGPVRAVRERATGAVFARKRIPLADRRELLLLARLRHPNVLALEGLGTDAEGPFAIVELADGGDLSAVLADPLRTPSLLADALRALAYLHSRGLIHADVKPQNLLAGAGGRLKLADLGLARAAGEGEAGGTLAYMAPERLRGVPATPAADLFGLGAAFAVALGAPLPRNPAQAGPELSRWLASSAPAAASAYVPVLCALLEPDPTRRAASARRAAKLLAQAAADPSLAHETPESRRAYLRPHALVRRDGALAALREASARAGVTRLRAAPGAGGTRVLEELALSSGLPFVDARRAADLVAPDGALLVDDADAADERAQAWLVETQRRAAEGEPAPRVVALVRPGGALDRRLALDGATSVELDPLDPLAVRELVADAFPERGDAGPLAARLHAISGGSPGRALAILAALDARGDLRAGALVDEDVPGAEVLDGFASEDLAGALARHVAPSLAEGSSARALAALAAIALRPFSEAVARRAFARDDFDEAARRLRDLRLLADGASFAPDGEHVRALLAGILDAAELDRARRSLAEALSTIANVDGDDAALVAAEDRARLLFALGEQATGVGAIARALLARSLAREASTLLADADARGVLGPDERVVLARALAQLGDFEAALAQTRRAAEEGAPGALLLAADLHVRRGDYASVVRELEPARGRAGADAELDAVLARALALSGQHVRALEVCDDGLSRATGAARIDLAITRALARFYKGDLEGARTGYAAARDLARDARDRAREANATNGLGLVAQRLGRFDEARGHYAGALALAEECGDRARVGTSHLNLGTVLQELGQTREAARAYRRSATVARLIGERVQSARARSNLANLLIYVGRLDEARTAADEARALADTAGAGVVKAYAVLLLGEAALWAGALDEAERQLATARDLFAAMDNVSEALDAEVLLARSALARGQRTAASAKALEAASRARGKALERHEAQALLAASEALAGDDDAKALATAHRALGLALPSGRPDLLWRAEAGLARASSDEDSRHHHAARAVRLSVEAASRVDEEDRESFLARPDRARLCAAMLPLAREGSASRGADARLQRLLNINRRLGAERNLKALLEGIVDQAVELCGAERGFVLLAPEREGGPLNVTVARNIDGESIGKGQLKVSHSIAERVIREGEPEMTLDAQEDERYQKQLSIAALKLRSIICVPLRFQGRTLGALYIDNRFRARAFVEDDLTLIEAFADQAAIALAQVRALEDARTAREQADRARAEIEALNAKLASRAEAAEIEAVRARREADEQRLVVARSSQFGELVGESAAMQRLIRQLERVAATDLPVLVTGESGTGKELVSKALFAHGARRDKPFVSVNCGALNEGILESELFGHVRGAFTGADRERDGLFQVADKGTLFLDEVGDMGLSMQVKLLRALQEGEIRKVGGKDPIRVDVRVVAATNRDLAKLMQEGTFREDLFYRLNVVSLQIPPLRNRLEDLPALCAKLLAELPGRESRQYRLSSEALALLKRYRWPGNVRELRWTLHNAALFAETDLLTPADFSNKPELLRGSVPSSSSAASPGPVATGELAGRSIEDLEAEAIRRTLELTKGNKSETARLLGIDRKTLYNKLARLRIRVGS